MIHSVEEAIRSSATYFRETIFPLVVIVGVFIVLPFIQDEWLRATETTRIIEAVPVLAERELPLKPPARDGGIGR